MSNEKTQKFDAAIDHFKQEAGGLRTGRATASLIDSIMVESYGARVPIAHIASINIPDAKTIAIQPWDKANAGAIEKAIQASNIGLNPVNDGNLIRLSIPSMTEERRKEMVKVLGQLTEQARIAIRNVREDIIKDLKRREDNKEVQEDQVGIEKKDLQILVDKYNDQIKEIAAAKEKEIMTI